MQIILILILTAAKFKLDIILNVSKEIKQMKFETQLKVYSSILCVILQSFG